MYGISRSAVGMPWRINLTSRAAELSGRQDPVTLHWFAAAMFDLGRTKEAVDTQRLALLLRPDDAELREQLQRMERK